MKLDTIVIQAPTLVRLLSVNDILVSILFVICLQLVLLCNIICCI